jgi:hypothetical protein
MMMDEHEHGAHHKKYQLLHIERELMKIGVKR